jgi:HD-GYP domain-containing protein (c-di-GMP phosphodiesterase class II)
MKNIKSIYLAGGCFWGLEKYIKNINDTVVELMKLIRENGGKSINISDLKAYDEYTYHHSLSVAVISIGLGIKLGLSESEIQKLGFAALMHDIGKMSIPHEIINKPGKLTDSEFEQIKRHSIYSEEYLQDNAIDDQEIYESVMAHHEKVDR